MLYICKLKMIKEVITLKAMRANVRVFMRLCLASVSPGHEVDCLEVKCISYQKMAVLEVVISLI